MRVRSLAQGLPLCAGSRLIALVLDESCWIVLDVLNLLLLVLYRESLVERFVERFVEICCGGSCEGLVNIFDVIR